MTDAVRVSVVEGGAEAELGLTVSQYELERAYQVSVPGPELDTLTVCGAGSAPPVVAEKDAEVVVKEIVGTEGGGAPPPPPPPPPPQAGIRSAITPRSVNRVPQLEIISPPVSTRYI